MIMSVVKARWLFMSCQNNNNARVIGECEIFYEILWQYIKHKRGIRHEIHSKDNTYLHVFFI